MSAGSAVEAIITRFRDQVSTPLSIPTEVPDESFSPPDDGSTYIRLNVNFGDRQARDFGGVTQGMDRRGVMTAQVFTDLGRGRSDASSIASSIESAFLRYSSSGITFGPHGPTPPPTTKFIGRSGQYFQTNVDAAFVASEFL